MNNEVIITCALTGSGDSAHKSPHVPVTPAEIAESAVKAAKAGAAIAHVHVRNPETKDASRELKFYEETAKLIRESGVDMILNITAGMGADFVPDKEEPWKGGPGTDMGTPAERAEHIVRIKPDIATLDCGSLNYATTAFVATLDELREQARLMDGAGVKIEMEVFELGHIWQAKTIINEGHIKNHKPVFQLCMGVPYGAEANTTNMVAMVNSLPKDYSWSSFALGRMQMPWVAQSVAMGGNVRVGLEDNIYLGKGHFATNEELVSNAKEIIERMGARVLSPAEAREKLNLK